MSKALVFYDFRASRFRVVLLLGCQKTKVGVSDTSFILNCLNVKAPNTKGNAADNELTLRPSRRNQH